MNKTLKAEKKVENPANQLLPSDVASEYEVINWVGGHRQRFGNFGVVDLKLMTLEKAERLVKYGFSKLQKREPSKVFYTESEV
jgi:hypothetical protein